MSAPLGDLLARGRLLQGYQRQPDACFSPLSQRCIPCEGMAYCVPDGCGDLVIKVQVDDGAELFFTSDDFRIRPEEWIGSRRGSVASRERFGKSAPTKREES